ncbi:MULTISPECIES: hypothetical protein [Pseudomonas]|uniref:hypothetical protein n=1 Tax=Pseudomonas TaxID=286 RepID=UPI001F3A88A1|nr:MULTISPECIES: hypothetical protein [Pseudomonas]MDG9888175.1 hypothetical protein [Pseudomonas juntendi]UJW24790.1 hypothetical protein L2Y89_11685 [Pseudomonas juntendi]
MIRPTASIIGRQQVEQAMKDLAQRLDREQRVLVGVPEGSGSYEDGLTIATVAAVNNFGSADGRIPARPFLQPAIEDGAPMYRRLAEVMLPRVLSGEMEMRTLMEQMGNLAEGHVKQYITDLRVPKNADSTIANKGSDNPLVHDGHLRQSIRYVIDDSTDPLEEGI